MIVYRIAKKIYLNDLSGHGAKLYGGRWNKVGLPLVYTSDHLSLAVLEMLANQIRSLVDDTYGYIQLQVPDKLISIKIEEEELVNTWRQSHYQEQTVSIGTNWLLSQDSAAMKVPSAVLAQENNILLNPLHKDFSKIKIIDEGELNLDGRLVIPQSKKA